MDNNTGTNGKSKINAVRRKKKSKRKQEKHIPTSALRLYIKLYCKKKEKYAKTKNYAKIEAINSWIMLSEHEKQQFHNKYMECREKYLERLVSCMDKAETFMKRKNPQRINLENNSATCITDPQSNNNEENLSQTVETLTYDHSAVKVKEDNNADKDEQDNSADKVEQDNSADKVEQDNSAYKVEEDHNADKVNKTECDENIDEDIDMDNFMTNTLEIQDGQHNSQQEPMRTSYPEPMPPCLKTGKELFQLIKTIDNDNETTWISLSKKEKFYYGKAVFTLKNDYIKKYKQYLESLTPRELFGYYNRTFH